MFADTISQSRRSRAEARARQNPIPLRPVLLRAGVVALLIGGVLTLINQSSAMFGAERLEFMPLALVFLTPFVVVAISQILGLRQAATELTEKPQTRTPNEPLWATVAGHGIPFRAVLIGLIAGSVNATISVAGGETLPLAPIAQAYALPMLFSTLSQALSYRRVLAGQTAVSPA